MRFCHAPLFLLGIFRYKFGWLFAPHPDRYFPMLVGDRSHLLFTLSCRGDKIDLSKINTKPSSSISADSYPRANG
jgi:hypothetical protein